MPHLPPNTIARQRYRADAPTYIIMHSHQLLSHDEVKCRPFTAWCRSERHVGQWAKITSWSKKTCMMGAFCFHFSPTILPLTYFSHADIEPATPARYSSSFDATLKHASAGFSRLPRLHFSPPSRFTAFHDDLCFAQDIDFIFQRSLAMYAAGATQGYGRRSFAAHY